MKTRLLISLAALCLSPLAQADAALDAVARLARGGAQQLALQRVEREQPANPADPRWLAWEALRLELLADLRRDGEVLTRIAQLPAGKPAAALADPAARAALRLNEPRLARAFAAQALWGEQPVGAAQAEARITAALRRLVEEVTRTLDAERATVFLNDEKSNELWSRFGSGLDNRTIRLPNRAGIAGWVFANGRLANIPNAYDDLRFNPASDRESGFITRSVLCVPLRDAAGKTLGVVQAINKRNGLFGIEDEERLQGFAFQAGELLDNPAAGMAPPGALVRALRRLVIDSHLAERRADLGFLALLRYRQDYAPLPAEEISAFAEKLLLADGVSEAANWLALHDDGGPLGLLVRLKSGLLSPQAAIAAARAALDPPTPAPPPPDKASRKNTLKSTPPPAVARPVGRELAAYWTVIGAAGEALRDPALQAEALERRLNLTALDEDGLFGARADALWKRYEELALAVANRAHLLIGEDQRWLALAVDNAAPAPLNARALFAYLARRGGSVEIREGARSRLAAVLIQRGLDVAAARLFGGDAAGEALLFVQLGPTDQARRSELNFVLGQSAAASGAHERAAGYFLASTHPRARRLAAENLVRAGFAEDARRVYEGLLK